MGVVCWYQKSKGRSPSEKASFVGPKFTRKGFGWLTENDTLKTKMEKSNHCSFGKLKSILKAPPIFLVALTPPYFLGVVFFVVAVEEVNLPSLVSTFPKKTTSCAISPNSMCFLNYLKGRRFFPYLASSHGENVVFYRLVLPCIMTSCDQGMGWRVRKASETWSVWGCWVPDMTNGECHPLTWSKWFRCLGSTTETCPHWKQFRY